MDRENPWFGVIPRISFADKETYVESETKQYDMVRWHVLILGYEVNLSFRPTCTISAYLIPWHDLVYSIVNLPGGDTSLL